MKTLRRIGTRSVCAAVLLLFCTACGTGNSHCRLCGAPASAYPCIVELSTGSIAELKPADYGTASYSNTGSVLLRSINTESVTAMIPTEVEPVTRRLFCDSCFAMLDEMTNSGYVLADLRDPSHVEVFGVEDGKELEILGYSISVRTDESSNRILVSAVQG